MKELSRLFKGSVEMISGLRSRQKKVLIADTNPEEVKYILHCACAQ
jgi:uncharacterized protein YggU (UPF0235/DUF167 family)